MQPPLCQTTQQGIGGRGEGEEQDGATHSAPLEVGAEKQQDLGHEHGERQVGVDVVALVPDGADRAEGSEAAG